MPRKKYEVQCGFRKWSIGWDDKNSAIVVKTSRHPIYEELRLFDICDEELIALSKMFADIVKASRP